MLMVSCVLAQDIDPFPKPITQNGEPIRVNVAEFASIPDAGGEAARMMLLVNEPGTRRLFVNDMRGPLYSVSYDGKTVTPVPRHQRAELGRQRPVAGTRARLPELRVPPAVQPARHARLRQVLHLHRHEQHAAEARLRSGRRHATRTTRCCSSGPRRIPPRPTYDGGAPRELFRFRQPFANHNGGLASFNPLAMPGGADFGLLYIGARRRRQRRRSVQRRAEPRHAVRQDPAHRSARQEQRERQVRHPGRQSVRRRQKPETLGEIYAYGVRNPQRFAWDPKNGSMFIADIGQNIVEEISRRHAGANLGWNDWEAASASWIARTSTLNQRRARSEGDVSDRRVRPPRSALRRPGRRSPASSSIAAPRSRSWRTC